MIYIKIGSKVLKESERDCIKSEFFSGKRFNAVIRSIQRIIKRDLKDFPEIDIIINLKNCHRILGRFCQNTLTKHKEYNFIKGSNPYIILFWHSIESLYNYKCVKGLNSVILHEYGHYKQWLLNERLGHDKTIKHIASGNVDKDLQAHKEYINQNKG